MHSALLFHSIVGSDDHIRHPFHRIRLLGLWMSKLSRQVSSAYSLSTCGFQLFNPLKESEESKNLGQAT